MIFGNLWLHFYDKYIKHKYINHNVSSISTTITSISTTTYQVYQPLSQVYQPYTEYLMEYKTKYMARVHACISRMLTIV